MSTSDLIEPFVQPLSLADVDPELATDFALNAPHQAPDKYSEEDIARRLRALRFKKHELANITKRFDRELARIEQAKNRATRDLKQDIASLEGLLNHWHELQPKGRRKSIVFPDGALRSRTSSKIEQDADAVLPDWATSVKESRSLNRAAVKDAIKDGTVLVGDDGVCIDATGEVLPFRYLTTTGYSVETEPVE